MHRMPHCSTFCPRLSHPPWACLSLPLLSAFLLPHWCVVLVGALQPGWLDPLDVGLMRFLILFLVKWILDGEGGGDAGPEPDEEHVKAVLARRLEEEHRRRAQARARQSQQNRRPAAAASGLSTFQAGRSSPRLVPKRAPRAPKPAAKPEKSLIDYAMQAPPVSNRAAYDDSPVACLVGNGGALLHL